MPPQLSYTLTSPPLAERPTDPYFGNPVGFLLNELANDDGLAESCKAEYVTSNLLHHDGYGKGYSVLGRSPTQFIVRLDSCYSGENANIGLGNHTNPTAEQSSYRSAKAPDIYIEKSAFGDLDKFIPVIGGYVKKPVVIGNRIFAIDGAKDFHTGNDGVGVLDFSDANTLEIVEFCDCEISSYVRPALKLPSSIDLTGKHILAVVKGRILPTNIFTMHEDNVIEMEFDQEKLSFWHNDDLIVHGEANGRSFETYTPPTGDNVVKYVNSEAYMHESFFILLDVPVNIVEYPVAIRQARNLFTISNYAEGILVNTSTGKVCHTITLKQGRKQGLVATSCAFYQPNHELGGAIYKGVPGDEVDKSNIHDSEMATHVVMGIILG